MIVARSWVLRNPEGAFFDRATRGVNGWTVEFTASLDRACHVTRGMAGRLVVELDLWDCVEVPIIMTLNGWVVEE